MPTKLSLVGGRFQVSGALPASGQSAAFLAHDLRTRTDVVLKLVPLADAAARETLLAEFALLACLDDARLPTVIEVGEDASQGAVFIALQRIEGVSADTACVELDGEARARMVARAVADGALALFALHQRGLVHHDVKPEHLLLGPDGHFRLIDLGLVRAVGRGDRSARGTLAYMSPDALVAASEPAMDLYALGVTAYRLLAGRLPYDAPDPTTLLAAMALPRTRLVGPSALTSLIKKLLDFDPLRRPSSAHLVAAELVRAGLVPDERIPGSAEVELPLRAGFVASASGREAVLSTFSHACETSTVVCLHGKAGSGRTRLVTELDRRHALVMLRDGRPRWNLIGPTLEAAATFLDARVGPQPTIDRMLDELAARSVVLHVETPPEALLRALAGRPTSRGPVQVIVELDESVGLDLPGLHVHVPALALDEVSMLCERSVGLVDTTAVKLAAALSGGRPEALLTLLRAARGRARAAGRVAPVIEDLRSISVEALEGEVFAMVARLAAAARKILAALELLRRPLVGGELRALVPTDLGSAIAALQLDGLASWEGDGLRADSQMASLAALQMLTERDRRGVTNTLLRDLDGREQLIDAALLAAVVRRADVATRARRALRAWSSGMSPQLHIPATARLMALADELPAREAISMKAELMIAAADYEGAIALIPERATAPQRLVLARALRFGGRSLEAQRIAESLVDEHRVGASARVLLARMLIDSNDFVRANALVAGEPPGPNEAEGWLEVSGIAALGLGDTKLAEERFATLQTLLASATSKRRARVDGLLGMVAQARGDLEAAANAYGSALGLADEAHDLHGAAIYAQNLGGVLRELGDPAAAQAPLERATLTLSRIGRPGERAMAHVNLGNLHLALGDRDAARRAADAALTDAHMSSRAALFATLLHAEIDRRCGNHDVAIDRYRRAMAWTAHPDRVLVDAGLAEALAEGGYLDEAQNAIATLAGQREPGPVRLHVALAESRARLRVDNAQLPDALRSELTAELLAPGAAQRRDRALRCAFVLARDAIRRADSAALARHLETARQAHEEMFMRTPELRRDALGDDPDIDGLRKLLAVGPAASDGSLRRLVELNKRINSELDLERLLDLILDTVIELSRAERGFLLLRSATGELENRRARNVDQASRDDSAAFSRSIAERAISEGEAIVTVDATGDLRFEAALSVSDLRLRSVLAVPLTVKGRVVGCVYVDHRARTGLFRPNDVALVGDLAEQAAIAIETARLLADNQRKEAEVRALNAQLERKLESQTVELEGMHREVREARRTLGVRHDYAGLIGQTPRMVELFRLLDRVTDTALPVVIYGESGTGKELVARAIHHNGPRRKAAFVSESCAAIPETLLEAALFGHVRGAFTGAQGERRGLFEIADGGTLFLDEVGEMSPGMQVRLLRVLQEGEFRRVGGEKMHKVDVRVLVASNHDLQRLVEAGKFREDLFYRLNVVRVALPPLRERVGDIPLLVEHFLAARPGQSITRGALELVCRYGWPGNVRQLQNEIARACSLADGPVTVADLSPEVQAGTEEADATAGPLDLHGRVERLERSLLKEALHRTGGNQSEAARLLGLSRFGLQKKLRRYEIKP